MSTKAVPHGQYQCCCYLNSDTCLYVCTFKSEHQTYYRRPCSSRISQRLSCAITFFSKDNRAYLGSPFQRGAAFKTLFQGKSHGFTLMSLIFLNLVDAMPQLCPQHLTRSDSLSQQTAHFRSFCWSGCFLS